MALVRSVPIEHQPCKGLMYNAVDVLDDIILFITQYVYHFAKLSLG